MRRVVLTLSSGALAGLAGAVGLDRITVEECPLLWFEPPDDWGPLDRALAELNQYRCVAFTSPRAAAAVASRWPPSRRDPLAEEARPVVWAAGPATAAPLGPLLGPIRMPKEPGAPGPGGGAGAALARAILAAGIGWPVLYPCGDSHREELADTLRGAGGTVHEVVCYRSVLASADQAGDAAQRADVLVVGSPRVAHLLAASPLARRPRLLALGPTTAAASRDRGWPPDAVAGRPTVDEVAEQIVRLLG